MTEPPVPKVRTQLSPGRATTSSSEARRSPGSTSHIIYKFVKEVIGRTKRDASKARRSEAENAAIRFGWICHVRFGPRVSVRAIERYEFRPRCARARNNVDGSAEV